MTKPATISIPLDVAKRLVAAWREEDGSQIAAALSVPIGELVGHIEASLAAEKTAMDGFDIFWSVWPQRKAKRPAQLSWVRTASVRPKLHDLLNAVRDNIATDQWKEGIIPLASTWLNQHRWDDELRTGPEPEPEMMPEQLAEAQKLSDKEFARSNPKVHAFREWVRKFEAENGRLPTDDARRDKIESMRDGL